jgi:hypothetical protein
MSFKKPPVAQWTDEYDYDSDSDLEYSNEDERKGEKLTPLSRSANSPKSRKRAFWSLPTTDSRQEFADGKPQHCCAMHYPT